MARSLRIQYENAYSHVTCRSNALKDIFLDDDDRTDFIELLARSAEIYQMDVLAFVLMTIHFYLAIKTPLGNLQEFMRHFNISYTSYLNRTHDRVGHLYLGHYKYLGEVSRYVHLNPLRIKTHQGSPLREKTLKQYRWSRYSSYVSSRLQYPCGLPAKKFYLILEAMRRKEEEHMPNLSRMNSAKTQQIHLTRERDMAASVKVVVT